MPVDGIRAFLALDLDEAMLQGLESLMAELRPRLQGVSWVRPEGMHLTLRFLGTPAPSVLDAMKPRLAEAASRCPATAAAVVGLGAFPERGRVRVLWIGVALPPSVLALQSECEAAAVAAGLAPEPRSFHPHLTLGRWREGAPRPELPDKDLGAACLRSLVVYRSDLHPGGARYTPLQRFALGGVP